MKRQINVRMHVRRTRKGPVHVRHHTKKIRKNYGMAIVHHGTDKLHASLIKKEGLLTANDLAKRTPMKTEMIVKSSDTDPDYTYFFTDKKHADSWAKVVSENTGIKPEVISFDIPDKKLEDDFKMSFGRAVKVKGGVGKDLIINGENYGMAAIPVKEGKYKFSDKTGVPILDYPGSFGKSSSFEMETVMMSPDEFLDVTRKTPESKMKDLSLEEYRKRIEFKPSTKEIKQGFKKGDEIDLPFLEYKGDYIDHEGRHRAFASKDLGIEKIPVKIIKNK